MIKSIVAAGLMFSALWFLTKDIRASAIGMAIPLVLSFLTPPLAYFLTGVVVVLAFAVAVSPARVKTQVSSEISTLYNSLQKAPTNDTGPAQDH